MIEHSPGGSVPHTPIYDEAIARLHATRQAYASADYKDGHVTARSLACLPLFFAANLTQFAASKDASVTLESNSSIFDRYLASLSAQQRSQAERFRIPVAGHPIHHRHKADADGSATRDPLNTIFLIPGAGPKPGLPGNYLHGSLSERQDVSQGKSWCIQVLDSDNDTAFFQSASFSEAVAKLQELLGSAPFHLAELEALGFALR